MNTQPEFIKTTFQSRQRYFLLLSLVTLAICMLLISCGGGADGPKCDEPPPRTFTVDQITAMTAIEMDKVTDDEIIGMGTNFRLLSNTALSKIKTGTVDLKLFCPSHKPQIAAIQASQIDALTPAQIRYIGSSDNGIAKIDKLNETAWMRIAANPLQVAAITVDEMNTISTDHFITFDTNIKYLSNAVIGSLKTTFISGFNNHASHVNAITAVQIAALTPSQVRNLGATATGISQIEFLNDSAWKKFFSDPVQAAAITSQEMLTISSAHIPMMGESIKYLSDSVFGVFKFTFIAGPTNLKSQIASITPEQIKVLSPAQIAIIASLNHGLTIASLDVYSFGALNPAQVGILTGINVDSVTAAQLAALSAESLAALKPDAIASLTSTQKSSLTTAQHNACGC